MSETEPEVIELKPAFEETNAAYMTEENINRLRNEEILGFDKLSFNDQGSAAWYFSSTHVFLTSTI